MKFNFPTNQQAQKKRQLTCALVRIRTQWGRPCPLGEGKTPFFLWARPMAMMRRSKPEMTFLHLHVSQRQRWQRGCPGKIPSLKAIVEPRVPYIGQFLSATFGHPHAIMLQCSILLQS
ncbi:hypothetical protein V8G54_020677 [Vigna mungo]|uniref:Uncharacterized protein n=1 Tax=Vigna mungo TaxID=3915 RepID=A0AAQ3NCY8_VIGMU